MAYIARAVKRFKKDVQVNLHKVNVIPKNHVNQKEIVYHITMSPED